jgi:uncharacterized protein (DUF1015 family)
MTAIRPFESYHASPELAKDVACPAYDAMTPGQRHEFALAHPLNYLNVMRSTDEFPEDQRPPFDENLQRNSAKLQELIRDGVFVYNDRPGVYVLRLAVDDHVQTGLIAEIPVDEFDQGGIKKHEHTRQDKEDILIRYRDKLRASSTPISLTYPADPGVDEVVEAVQQREPLIDFVSDDGLAQSLWFVGDPDEIRALQDAFAQHEALYLTDGHHRTAVCQKWAAKRRAENPEHTGDEPYNFVLTAIFPDREMRILEYNRLVRDLNGLSVEALLGALGEHFDVEPLNVAAADEARPVQRHQFSMYVDSRWYSLMAPEGVVEEDDPVRRLDVCVLQELVLGPLLGIDDPRTDPRIDYVPGAFGLDELERRVHQGWAIGFACYPTSVQELMAIADAGEVMPPKSTWFDPKVRSGLLVRLR